MRGMSGKVLRFYRAEDRLVEKIDNGKAAEVGSSVVLSEIQTRLQEVKRPPRRRIIIRKE